MPRQNLYPVYIHHQANRAYGAILPDLPGVHSAADELVQLPDEIREAVALMYESDPGDVPPPSPITSYIDKAEYEGGFWMLVDITPHHP
ncbi:type II toxin-antitoxin system HicB family antitoxin [uncultured Stenotrophomonas sp.]|uniref:type II toxin-antitoxin system HicB family antitoxin n=1 Tax=uncultured Stenotrophomonas sp. TaxID=165438 RepID=UPI0028E435C9|nr:type II toxin-antitoxin system HicB family antitoxin [uncultured Stenotrophomonas sp.]